MNLKKTYHIISALLLSLAITGCVEDFEDFKTEFFESALVIEATITDEFKQQEILLSRTFALEADGPTAETNADVRVIDDAQNEYIFQETEEGKYVSTTAFSAEPNRNYSLAIKTTNGRSYASKSTQITQTSHIDKLVAIREFNKDTIEGVSILIDSYDPTGKSKYYRYTYEETYKIIAPKYSSINVVFNEGSFSEFHLPQRPEQEKVCYNTVVSNNFTLTNSNNLNEDRIVRFPVKFVQRDNYIISYRYSILVKQHILSREAFAYYETLKNLSEFESIFSDNQPGFFAGNVFSEDNSTEKVIGFFDISSVDSKRIYFNYEDLFPNEDLPPFVIGCNTPIAPEIKNGCVTSGETEICNYPLFESIRSGYQYFTSNEDNTYGVGPLLLVPRECGDCTALGKNEIPDFWIE